MTLAEGRNESESAPRIVPGQSNRFVLFLRQATRQPYLRPRSLFCLRSLRSDWLRPIGFEAEAWAVTTQRLGSRHSSRQLAEKCPVHEAPSQEPWHAAARDVRYRYAAGQL